MTVSARNSTAGLFDRLKTWRAGRLLRFCWAVASGSDLKQAGFDFDAQKLEQVKQAWPLAGCIEILSSFGGKLDEIAGHLKPFAKNFLYDHYSQLSKAGDEDARVQLLWLQHASSSCVDRLTNRIVAMFSRNLTPPKKRVPKIRNVIFPHRPYRYEHEKQKARDLARGRRLLMAEFSENILATILTAAKDPNPEYAMAARASTGQPPSSSKPTNPMVSSNPSTARAPPS